MQIEISEKALTFRKEYGDSQLPAHEGYEQLCIILEKQGNLMKRYNLPNKQRNKVGVVLGTDELKGARKT